MVKCLVLMMKQTIKNFFNVILRYRCYTKMKKMGRTRFLEFWCDGTAEKPCAYCPYFIGKCTIFTNSRGNRSKEGEYYP